jgi:hypothetical protein
MDGFTAPVIQAFHAIRGRHEHPRFAFEHDEERHTFKATIIGSKHPGRASPASERTFECSAEVSVANIEHVLAPRPGEAAPRGNSQDVFEHAARERALGALLEEINKRGSKS